MENPEKMTEKRVELVIDRMVAQLIKDLEKVEEENRVNSNNLERMCEAFNHLAKAEYHILRALLKIKDVDHKMYIYTKNEDFYKKAQDDFKKKNL